MESHTKVDHEYHRVPSASTMAAFKTCVTSMCRSGFLNRALVQFLAIICFFVCFFLDFSFHYVGSARCFLLFGLLWSITYMDYPVGCCCCWELAPSVKMSFVQCTCTKMSLCRTALSILVTGFCIPNAEFFENPGLWNLSQCSH